MMTDDDDDDQSHNPIILEHREMGEIIISLRDISLEPPSEKICFFLSIQLCMKLILLKNHPQNVKITTITSTAAILIR